MLLTGNLLDLIDLLGQELERSSSVIQMLTVCKRKQISR